MAECNLLSNQNPLESSNFQENGCYVLLDSNLTGQMVFNNSLLTQQIESRRVFTKHCLPKASRSRMFILIKESGSSWICFNYCLLTPSTSYLR